MKSKIGDYQIVEKLSSDSVFLAKDNAGSKKLLKHYELDLSWPLKSNVITTLMTLKHANLLPPSYVFEEEKSRYAVYEYSHSYNR